MLLFKAAQKSPSSFHKLSKDIRLSIATIPLSIFKAGLGPLEAIVKYLYESQKLSLSEIARLTGRSRQAIFITYRNSKKKQDQEIRFKSSRYAMPAILLCDPSRSTLEAIVSYLKDTHSIPFKKVAEILNRSESTVRTAYIRAIKKAHPV